MKPVRIVCSETASASVARQEIESAA